jgi:hypothetical protein
MELLQFTLKGINAVVVNSFVGDDVRSLKLSGSPVGFRDSSPRLLLFTSRRYNIQHVQRPAALRGFDFADGFEPGVTGANLGGVGRQTGGDDGDAGFGREPNVPISRTDPFPFPDQFQNAQILQN